MTKASSKKSKSKIKEQPKKEIIKRSNKEVNNLLDAVVPLYPIAAKNAAGPILKRQSNRDMFAEIIRERLPGVTEEQVERAIKERFKPK